MTPPPTVTPIVMQKPRGVFQAATMVPEFVRFQVFTSAGKCVEDALVVTELAASKLARLEAWLDLIDPIVQTGTDAADTLAYTGPRLHRSP